MSQSMTFFSLCFKIAHNNSKTCWNPYLKILSKECTCLFIHPRHIKLQPNAKYDTITTFYWGAFWKDQPKVLGEKCVSFNLLAGHLRISQSLFGNSISTGTAVTASNRRFIIEAAQGNLTCETLLVCIDPRLTSRKTAINWQN